MASVIPLLLMFDIIMIGFITLLPMMKDLSQSIFLIHGTIVIMCVSLICRRQREYRSVPLMILAIWALINMFGRSFTGLKTGDEIAGYFVQNINWTLLNEGFLYIFFGILLIKTIVEYSKHWKWYFVPVIFWVVFYLLTVGLGLNFGPQGIATKGLSLMGIFRVWSREGWSITPLLAVLIGATLTMLKHERTRLLSIVTIVSGIGIVIYKWTYIWGVKWISRPDFWKATIQRIMHSPLGYGFYQTVNTKDGLVAPELPEFGSCLRRWGRGWRQNDFLEITEYLGVIAGICITWFLIGLFWRSKGGIAYFLGITALCMCLFQRTMFFPIKAGIIEVIIALLILENRKYELVET